MHFYFKTIGSTFPCFPDQRERRNSKVEQATSLLIVLNSFQGDPCAEMPCFNGAQCKNDGKTNFKCICPSGFSGPTCKDVGRYTYEIFEIYICY
jgi:hypothetical protein